MKTLEQPFDTASRAALAAWTGFMRAAQSLKSEGSFAGLASLVSYAEVNSLFEAD